MTGPASSAASARKTGAVAPKAQKGNAPMDIEAVTEGIAKGKLQKLGYSVSSWGVTQSTMTDAQMEKLMPYPEASPTIVRKGRPAGTTTVIIHGEKPITDSPDGISRDVAATAKAIEDKVGDKYKVEWEVRMCVNQPSFGGNQYEGAIVVSPK